MTILSLFPTQVFVKKLKLSSKEITLALNDIKDLKRQDAMGREWSAHNYFGGYTSYSSVSDLPHRYPSFSHIKELIDAEKNAYVKSLNWRARPQDISMTSCWANVMGKGCHHSFHIHPQSVLSGTLFLQTPVKGGNFKIQDPRLTMFMARPEVKESAAQQAFYEIKPEPGTLLLFESWLAHEVPANLSNEERVSLSFNFHWNPS